MELLSILEKTMSCLVFEMYLRATIGVLELLKLRGRPRFKKKLLNDIGNEFHGFVLTEQCPATSVQLSLYAREDIINS
ncbi:hypothetical protein ACJMK2_027932 [Sinanodonta woodiana]|uniref:Uncharacterized protein n=1 Tax=Sinanodonta woodiana TaxID=1069815 RepID=A0ABD3X9C6_SINWO